MRKRLLACLIFGVVGLAAAFPLGERLGIGTIPSLAGGLVAGVFLGYLVSVFMDVFQSGASEIEN